MARQQQRTAAAQASDRRELDRSARKAQPIALKRHVDRRAAARAAIAEGSTQFLHNVSLLARADTAPGSGSDPELVHQARVGLRRLRVFVRLFRKQIGRTRARAMADELRWLFVVLGRLRDLQVFRETRLPNLEAEARTLATVRAALRRQTAAAERTVDAALRSERFDDLCHALATVQQRLESPARASRPTRRWLARRLQRQQQRALRHASRQDVSALHDLRKELKSLRYTAELAAALYPRRGKRVRSYLSALRAVQDVLGAWVDQQVARELLSQLAVPSPLRQRLDTQLAHEDLARLTELSQSLPAFTHAEPFWS